jgi:hypothetical protein
LASTRLTAAAAVGGGVAGGGGGSGGGGGGCTAAAGFLLGCFFKDGLIKLKLLLSLPLILVVGR